MDEHPLCFPQIGGINIHALKVKRRGFFYHLSDSMFVRSAFHGVSKSWFLSVEASNVGEQSESQHLGVARFGIMNKPSADGLNLLPYCPATKLSNIDDSSLPQVQRRQIAGLNAAAGHNAHNNCNRLSLETNHRSDTELQVNHDLIIKEYEYPVRHTEYKEESSKNVTCGAQVNVSLEGSSKNGSVAKKRRVSLEGSVVKKRRKSKKRSEDEVHNHALKQDGASAPVSDKDASQQDNVIPDNSLLNQEGVTVVTHIMESGSKDITDEPCRISSSDANKTPGSEIQMIEVLREGTAVPGKHIEDKKCTSENAVLKDQHDISMEEASPGIAVKKKEMTVRNDDNENSFKDGRILICDSTKETSDPGIISQCSLGDKQKGSSANLDHVSTEILKADHSLTINSRSGKKKRARKSSKSVSQVVASVPYFAEEDKGESSLDTVRVRKNSGREPDAAVVPGQNVQDAMASEPSSISMKEHPQVPVQEEGEHNKVTSSFDDDVPTTDAVIDKNNINSTEVAAISAVERVRVSEDNHAITTESNHTPSVQEVNNHNNDGVSRKENVIVNDALKLGNHQFPIVAEERGLSQNNDPNAMPSAKFTVSNRDDIDMNSKVIVITDLGDANGNVVPGKSSKKRKKSRKARDTVASGTEHTTNTVVGISSSEPHEPAYKDHSSDTFRKEERILSPVVGKEESKTTVNASERETDNVIQNVLESLQDISKKSGDVENRDGKSRKKTKRKRNSAAEKLTELQAEDKDVNYKNATPSIIDMEVELEESSKFEEKTKLVKASPEQSKKKTAIETNHEGINEGKSIQDLNNVLKSGSTDEANSHVEVSCESDRTIVNDNFVPSQHQHEIDLQSSLKLNQNQGDGGEAQLQAKRKLPKVSGIGARALPPDVVDEKPEEATRAYAVSASGMLTRSGKKGKAVASSSTSLGNSKSLLPRSERNNGHQSHVEERIFSRNNANGAVVNGSKPKKSLLVKSGTIFEDDSDGSSNDEDGVDNSDGSTKAPSDNSLSSNYSDGVSTAIQNGSVSSQRMDSARRNIIKPNSGVKLDKIMRRSDNYKASKLTASQLQLQATESQPVEFVPDSQANP